MSASQCLNAPFIPRDEEGLVFSAPWEARAFAMVSALYAAGHFTWKEWVDVFSAQIARAESSAHVMAGHTDDYYECWVVALETLLKAKGTISDEVLAEAMEITLETWPHPDHVVRRDPVALDPPQP